MATKPKLQTQGPSVEERAELERDGFKRACAQRDVPSMMPRAVELEGVTLLVCRDLQGFVAFGENCPHEQLSMRFGIVHNGEFICPHHGYRFDTRTGKAKMRRCEGLTHLDLRVVHDEIWIRPR